MSFFITGTDTGAGKTYCTALLLRALRREGIDAVGMKPICAGERDDAEMLHAACDGIEPINLINPIWYRTPAAPYTAAMVEERPVDLDLIGSAYLELRERHESVLVEGVGGWRVPITRDYYVSNLAIEMGLPVILVVRNRLGALNHALLSIELIRQSGVPFAGYIVNHADPTADHREVVAEATNSGILSDLLGFPPLFTIEKDQAELPPDVRRRLQR